MKFLKNDIPGLVTIIPDIHEDSRGAFVKTLHKEYYDEAGLVWRFDEEYYSVSAGRVLRGLHFQTPPRDHAKLVYCIEGAVIDAVLDLRRGSPTFGRHAMVPLSDGNRRLLYLPRGLAHAFYVMSSRATLVYKTETVHYPAYDRGILWSSAGIEWPDADPILSDRDKALPLMKNFESPFEYHE